MEINEALINNFLSYLKNEGKKEKTIYTNRYNFMAFYHWLKENKKDTVEQVDKLNTSYFHYQLVSMVNIKIEKVYPAEL